MAKCLSVLLFGLDVFRCEKELDHPIDRHSALGQIWNTHASNAYKLTRTGLDDDDTRRDSCSVK